MFSSSEISLSEFQSSIEKTHNGSIFNEISQVKGIVHPSNSTFQDIQILKMNDHMPTSSMDALAIAELSKFAHQNDFNLSDLNYDQDNKTRTKIRISKKELASQIFTDVGVNTDDMPINYLNIQQNNITRKLKNFRAALKLKEAIKQKLTDAKQNCLVNKKCSLAENRKLTALKALPTAFGLLCNTKFSKIEIEADIKPTVSKFRIRKLAGSSYRCPDDCYNTYFNVDQSDYLPKKRGFVSDVRILNRSHGKLTENVCSLVGRFLLDEGNLKDDFFKECPNQLDANILNNSLKEKHFPNMQVQYEVISLKQAWEDCDINKSMGFFDSVDVCDKFFPRPGITRYRKNSVRNCVRVENATAIPRGYFNDLCREMGLSRPFIISDTDNDDNHTVTRIHLPTNSEAFRLLKDLRKRASHLRPRLTRSTHKKEE
ncbi:hypothetical protein GJ496_007610 [Pomphorhynchus laevis]|nr:hypothetical protein GJ496_007610 [Pomphorhynchus laevis]